MFNALPSEIANIKEMRERQQFVSGTGFDAVLYQPKDFLHYLVYLAWFLLYLIL